MLFQFSIQIMELLCAGFSGQSKFFPIGLKSKQGRHLLNMRMALAAGMRGRPARAGTFVRLNPGCSGQSPTLLTF
jgi:hypothetical protein